MSNESDSERDSERDSEKSFDEVYTNTTYTVYIRSQTTYTDHKYKPLLYFDRININLILADFDTQWEAKEFILDNGQRFTREFYGLHKQGCAFYMRRLATNNEYSHLEELEEEPGADLCWINRTFEYKNPTSCFSEYSYKMLLNEHFIYVSRDMAEALADHIVYHKSDGTIFYGSDRAHFDKCNAFYNEEWAPKNVEEFEAFNAKHNAGLKHPHRRNDIDVSNVEVSTQTV